MTDTSQTVPPLRIAPPPPGWTPGGAIASGPTRAATASLVLGIVSLVLNLLLVPTILAIVFGAVALSRRTAGRTRAIVGIVLGVLGIIGVGVQIAIAIPVYLGVQHAAIASSMEASITNGLAQQGAVVKDVECPPPGALRAGATELCSATSSTGADLRILVTFTDSRGGFTYRVDPTG